jgi:hypothetical protein
VGARKTTAQDGLAADAAAAGKQLLRQDPRFETLLWLSKDLDAAIAQLAWDYEYMRWFAAFQKVARRIPAVPAMSTPALAFLKRLASHGDADALWKLEALERARVVSEEAQVARKVSLADARALPSALEDQRVMMGVLALQSARRLRLELEPRHLLLLAIWAELEEPTPRRAAWDAALRRWTRLVRTIEDAEEKLERATRARARESIERAALRRPPTSE